MRITVNMRVFQSQKGWARGLLVALFAAVMWLVPPIALFGSASVRGEPGQQAPNGEEPLVSPLPARVIQQRLYVTGISQPNQSIRIYRKGQVAAETISNQSGDFAAAVLLYRGKNLIEAVNVVLGNEVGSSDPQEVEFSPQTSAGEWDSSSMLLDVSGSLLAPVLDQPTTPATSNPIMVTGTAAASVTIRFFVNGVLAQTAMSATDGTFSAHVPLEDGSNAIYAIAEDGSGQSPASNTVSVSYANQVPRVQGGTLAQDTAWTRGDGTPYAITTNLVVPVGVTLWLEPGATLKFSANVKLLVQGALVIRGQSANRVVLTSSKAVPVRGDWPGIEFASTATGASIDYAQIEYANYGVYFNQATPGIGTISNSLIRNNARGIYIYLKATPLISGGNEITANQYGVFVQGNNNVATNPAPVVTGNAIYGNAYSASSDRDYYAVAFGNPGTTILDATGNWWGTADPIAIAAHITDWTDSASAAVVDYSGYLGAVGGSPVFTGPTLTGQVSADTTLTATEYQVLGNVEVKPGVTLTIPAGASLTFTNNYRLLVNGSLQVQGSAAQRVVFTSGQPVPARNDWAGIEISATATNVTIDYAQIEYANYGVYFSQTTPGVGTISNSLIRNNVRGIFVYLKATPLISGGNEITANQYGVYVQGNNNVATNPAPVVTGNAIYGNAYSASSDRDYYAVAFGNPGTTVLDATGNWWGTTDPALIASHITDWSDSSSAAIVDFSGFLDSQGGQVFLLIYDVVISQSAAKPLQGISAAGTYTLNSGASVELQIRREADDALVFSDTQVHSANGQYPIAWDGRDNLGNAKADGLYRVVLLATSGTAQFLYDPPQPTTIGSVSGAVPATFDPYRNSFWKIQVNMASPGLVTLQATPQGSPVFTIFDNMFLPAGHSWVYWNGRDPSGAIVSAKSYMYFPPPSDLRSTAILVTGTTPTITGTGAAPNIEVKSNPYLITHSYEEVTSFAYRIDLDSHVTVKLLPPGIYDPAHASAITLVDEELQSAVDGLGQPIDHIVNWQGFDPADTNAILTADEGVFTISIEATSTQTNNSSRYFGVLNIQR